MRANTNLNAARIQRETFLPCGLGVKSNEIDDVAAAGNNSVVVHDLGCRLCSADVRFNWLC